MTGQLPFNRQVIHMTFFLIFPYLFASLPFMSLRSQLRREKNSYSPFYLRKGKLDCKLSTLGEIFRRFFVYCFWTDINRQFGFTFVDVFLYWFNTYVVIHVNRVCIKNSCSAFYGVLMSRTNFANKVYVYQGTIDHRTYTHNLGSCEIKAWKNSGLNGIRTHDLMGSNPVQVWIFFRL